MKHLYIILLCLPFIGFGQDLVNSMWKITGDNGYGQIILLKDDGSFIGLSDIYGVPVSFEDPRNSEMKYDWLLTGNLIVLRFSDNYMIKTGEVRGNLIIGTSSNQKGFENSWVGERIN